MGLLGGMWAIEDADVRSPGEKMVLWHIAKTAFEGDNAEINFPALMKWAVVDEPELRKILNALFERKLLTDMRPLNESVPSFICKLGEGSYDEMHH